MISILPQISYAQSDDFNSVYKACVLAQSSMSDGQGSQVELREASGLLIRTEWSPLILQNVDVNGEVSIKNHMVFSPEFLADVVKDHSVYRRARRYAEELMSSQRGGKVQLTTKCIKANRTVTYTMRKYGGGKFNIATVAEPNGLINLSVVIVDGEGRKSGTYKSSSEEFKGAPSRLLKCLEVPEGNSSINISIENKSDENKSVAIIVE